MQTNEENIKRAMQWADHKGARSWENKRYMLRILNGRYLSDNTGT